MIEQEMQLENAAKYIENKDFNAALDIYKDILEHNPEEPILYECLSNIGFLYFINEQFDDSLNVLSEALLLPLTGYHGQINKTLGEIYLKHGNAILASEYFLEALVYLDYPFEIAIVKYEIGKILLELNDLDLSAKYLKDSESYFKMKHTTYYHSVIYYLGMNSFMKEEIELAESYFNVLLSSKGIKNNELVHAYFGLLHISNYHKDADAIFENASKILELDPKFYDKETLTYMTIKAYEYQNRAQEYFTALNLFKNDYPDGKYASEYSNMGNKEFKSVN